MRARTPGVAGAAGAHRELSSARVRYNAHHHEDALLQWPRRVWERDPHDLALAEVPKADGPGGADREEWSPLPRRVGLNHVAISWPDRGSWLKQIAFLQRRGVPFHRRVNHGMTHSVYVSDPDGHGIEVLYELPREVWEGDIDAAQNYAEELPREGDESLVDRTDNPEANVKGSDMCTSYDMASAEGERAIPEANGAAERQP